MSRRGTATGRTARLATLLPALALAVLVVGAYGLTRSQAAQPSAEVYAQTERWAHAIQEGDAEAALAFHRPRRGSEAAWASAEARRGTQGLVADFQGGAFSIIRVERGADPGGAPWLATVQFGRRTSVVVRWGLDSDGTAWIR